MERTGSLTPGQLMDSIVNGKSGAPEGAPFLGLGRRNMIGTHRTRAAILVFIALAGAAALFAQENGSYASVGFMGISPNLSDARADFRTEDLLYGGTVSFAVNPWFSLGADVLWLGDIYYGPEGAIAFGPTSWAALVESGNAGGAKADWKNFESLIYAPLTFNLTIPLGFLKPYLGAGPAFYFHFPSNLGDSSFTEYLDARYGAGKRIKTGLTARAGIDIMIGESLSLGLGYLVREDIPALLPEHLGNRDFWFVNGYLFASARLVMR